MWIGTKFSGASEERKPDSCMQPHLLMIPVDLGGEGSVRTCARVRFKASKQLPVLQNFFCQEWIYVVTCVVTLLSIFKESLCDSNSDRHLTCHPTAWNMGTYTLPLVKPKGVVENLYCHRKGLCSMRTLPCSYCSSLTLHLEIF